MLFKCKTHYCKNGIEYNYDNNKVMVGILSIFSVKYIDKDLNNFDVYLRCPDGHTHKYFYSDKL